MSLAGPSNQPGSSNHSYEVCIYRIICWLQLLTIILQSFPNPEPNPEDDLSFSIAERRSRRKIQLPVRLRDYVASSLAELPPEPHQESPTDSSPVSSTRTRRFIDSSKNLFGLFRRYFSNQVPTHDPEELVDLEALAESASGFENAERVPGGSVDIDTEQMPNDRSLYPFPNESSFRLGEWYWSDGAKKSLSGFHKLVDVVGSEDFKPVDVRQAKWAKINQILGHNDFDNDDRREDALFEDTDASWQKTPITITVPFNRRAKHPGPKEFLVGDLYHRSLVSVIREKLANSRDDELFHYEPYQLHWQPQANVKTSVRVHGELYTSPAFLEAHNELQDAPGEPGCMLPRVVVAMMFSSDATQLTSFGDAKLWPCYLYFGNESKYRRCKPTCKLCNHVAYFQTVCSLLKIKYFKLLTCSFSCLTVSKILQRSTMALVVLARS